MLRSRMPSNANTETSPMHVRSRTSAEEATFPLLIAIWFGLLSGLIEVAILTVKKLHFSPITRLRWDFVWMAPLAEMTFFLIAGLFIFCLSKIWRRVDQLRLILVCALLGLLNVLLLFPVLNENAAAVVATGVAAQRCDHAKYLDAHCNHIFQ